MRMATVSEDNSRTTSRFVEHWRRVPAAFEKSDIKVQSTTIEKIGWLSEDQVLESCKRKIQPLLLNTPFATRLRDEGEVFFHVNKKEVATGKPKKSFQNVYEGVSKGMTIYIGAIIRQSALPHAWLVDEDLKVLELTPRNEGLQVYFGVPVNKKEYKRLFKHAENMLDVYMSKDL